MPIWWLLPVAVAFALSIVLTDVIQSFAIKHGYVDMPDRERKVHKNPVPLLGGVAIYSAFAIATAAVLLFSDHLTAGEIADRHIIGLLFGGWILIIGGVVDDLYELKPMQSVVFPILAALIAVFSGIGVSKVTNPFGEAFEIGKILSGAFTFVWLICVIYTTKLLDGLDGLATGVSSIGMMMIALLALSAAYFQPDVALLAFIGFAACFGFLFWNTYPASIFLGEGGSTFIGYLLGVLAIIAGSKIATALLVVGVPALDVAFVMFDRWKHGDSIIHGGDRKHLHHRLLDAGLSHRQVVGLYYIFALGFGLTTLIFESWQKLLALSLLFVIMLIFVKSLSIRASYER